MSAGQPPQEQEKAEEKPLNQAGSSEKPSEEATKPTQPRTLGQAIHVYLRCLCSPKPPPRETPSKSADNNKAEKEEAGSRMDSEPKDNPDTKSGKQEAKKSPTPESAAGSKKEADETDMNNGEQKKESEEKPEKEPEPAWYSAHAQATVVIQKHGGFHAPYQGPNSLLENEPAATSMTGTLFLDVRLWECDGHSTELVFNPEIAGGTGLSGTTGIAGFPNGEITRVGAVEPTPYIARLFVRQTWGLGGGQENVEEAPNEIAGKRDVDRIVLNVGKFSCTDFADDNKFSHDPRTQFLPWSLIYNGAWDYPANVRGYTYGIEAELIRKDWTLSYGIVAEPEVANGAAIDPHFTRAFGQFLEYERRYKLFNHPGSVRLLAYLNRAHMGDYAEATAAMPANPDVTQTRAYRFKYGFGVSWDQEITRDLGIWARLGWNDGHTEAWAFTAIDRLFDIGLLLKGRCWCRPDDFIGLAYGINGLEGTHRNYLAAGGLDFIIGDGALNYAPEQILEAFYNLQVRKGINVTTDFQEVINPAYNADRGPVSIVALRVHFEY
jgi:high affinity Mn2+ porin